MDAMPGPSTNCDRWLRGVGKECAWPEKRDVVRRSRATRLVSDANGVERIRGIEPRYSAWEADVLPLNYIRMVQTP